MTIGVYFIDSDFTRSDTFFEATKHNADADEQRNARIALIKFGAYKLIGQLNHLDYTSDLEDAWSATQNIESPWIMADTVIQADDNGHERADKQPVRSSMVGDIFVQNGHLFMVAGCGFERLPEGLLQHL